MKSSLWCPAVAMPTIMVHAVKAPKFQMNIRHHTACNHQDIIRTMATDTMQGLVSEAKRNRFSTIPKLSDEDVIAVWDAVASFIETNMSQQKGVCMPGFGVFTFTQKKLDVSGSKYILIQRPVFVLSEKFAATHALQAPKYHITGQIPVVQLNYAALSTETPFDRDTVEGCVKEMLQAFSRSIQGKRNVEFVFSGIGKLSIKDSKVKMKFYKDFLQNMDGSGYLIDALTNRPHTTDSVLSTCSTPDRRSLTSNTLVLPRITPGQDLADKDTTNKKGALAAIEEEDPEAVDKDTIKPPGTANSGSVKSQILNLEGEEEKFMETDKVNSAPPRLENASEDGHRLKTELRSPRSLGEVRKSPKLNHENIDLPGNQLAPKLIKGSSVTYSVPQKPRTASGSREERIRRPKNPAPPPKTAYPRSKVFDKGCSGCLHAAGQELCYLCYQRERRNYAVDHREEKRRKEMEEDRMLQQYQQLKDAETMIREQGLKSKNREENSKIAAFNLGVAEAVKSKKNERPTSFHRSYVFHRRPVTPPHYIKQEEYSDELAKQVRQKATTEKKETKERDFMERLEQVQLAEDLAMQREQYLKNKRLQSEEYRKALDTQIYIRKCIESQMGQDLGSTVHPRQGCKTHSYTIPKPNIVLPFQHAQVMRVKEPGTRMVRFKPLPIPATQPDSDAPVFGIHDLTEEKLEERRKRARKLYEDQLQMAAEKQRQKMLRDLENQKEEINMLAKTKTELLQEMSDRNEKHSSKQKDLEENWAKSAHLKQLREAEETLRAQTPGVLIHEQCHKYRRCKLCKRHLGNSGESNVWSESRYVPGSRLIV